jgi:CubicO group peptidase (beta-lactamase class C family)
MKPIFIFSLLTLSTWGICRQDSMVAKLNAYFKDIDHTKHPGLSISLLENGKIVYRNSFGMSNLENGTPFKEETVSDIGSVAKHITNFALLHLINENNLTLNDSLATFFPTLKNHPAGKITLQQLMQHTSGLREIYSKLALQGGRMGQPIFQEDALNLVEASESLNFPAGSSFSYCNTGYMLLAEIIQKVSKMYYEAYLKEKIFQPLSMSNSYVMDKQGEIFPNMSNSYHLSQNKWTAVYDNSTAFGQGGIYMSQQDIEKWFLFLTSAETNKERPIQNLLKKTILNNGDTLNYAFGIENNTFGPVNYWQHTGSSAGFRAAFTWIPETNLVLILKSNYSSFNAIKTTEDLLSILFSLPQKAEKQKVNGINPENHLSLDPKDGISWQGDYYSKEMDVMYSFILLENKLYCKHPLRGSTEVKKDLNGNYVANPFFTSLRPITDKKGNITHIFMDTSDLIHLKFEKIR